MEIQGDVFFFSDPNAIYQLTCSSGVCSWSTLNQALKVARHYAVAIPVPDYFCLEEEEEEEGTTTTK